MQNGNDTQPASEPNAGETTVTHVTATHAIANASRVRLPRPMLMMMLEQIGGPEQFAMMAAVMAGASEIPPEFLQLAAQVKSGAPLTLALCIGERGWLYEIVDDAG